MGGMEYLLNINNLVLTCLNKYPYEFPVFLSSPYDEKDIVTISDSERAAATASSSNSEQQQQRAAATVSSSNSEQQQQREIFSNQLLKIICTNADSCLRHLRLYQSVKNIHLLCCKIT